MGFSTLKYSQLFFIQGCETSGTYRERKAACLSRRALAHRCQLYSDKFHLIDVQRDPVLRKDPQPIAANRIKVPEEIEIARDARSM